MNGISYIMSEIKRINEKIMVIMIVILSPRKKNDCNLIKSVFIFYHVRIVLGLIYSSRSIRSYRP